MKKIIVSLVSVGMLLAVTAVAQAAPIASFDFASSDAGLPVQAQAGDLLHGVVAPDATSNMGFVIGSFEFLTNGVASQYPSGAPDERTVPNGSTSLNWVLTYSSLGGITIPEIRTFSNSKDNRVEQDYDLAFSTNNGVSFTDLITNVKSPIRGGDEGDLQDPNFNYLVVRVVDDAGASLATNVTDLRFTYRANQDIAGIAGRRTRHVALYEIDVVPEPSSLVLTTLAVLGLGLCVWRHRKRRP